jgi:hypothetical protein
VVEILENMTVKLHRIVDSYLSGHCEAADYVLPEKSLSSSVGEVDGVGLRRERGRRRRLGREREREWSPRVSQMGWE